jgi:hypothetical protein
MDGWTEGRKEGGRGGEGGGGREHFCSSGVPFHLGDLPGKSDSEDQHVPAGDPFAGGDLPQTPGSDAADRLMEAADAPLTSRRPGGSRRQTHVPRRC